MKKILCFIAPMAMLFLGCTKELMEIPENPFSGNSPVFTATFSPDGQTRTVLAENGKNVLWSGNETICIFDGEDMNYEYSATNTSEDGKSTSFSSPGAAPADPDEYWYALYPYDEEATIAGGVITTTLKNEYSVTGPGTFTDETNIAVAKSKSLSLPFKNVLSYVKVAAGGFEDVVKIEFRGNNNELVAGKINIDYTGDAPVATIVEGTDVMTVNVENFVSSTNADRVFFYVPVLPGTYEKGFTLTFTSESGATRTFSIEKSVTFKRGEPRGMFADLTANTYKRVESVEDIDEVTDAKYLLVYPSGSNYYAFSFQKTMENMVAEANRLSDVHSLEELKNQASTIYQNVLKTNYVTATSTDGGATLTIDNEEDEEGAVIVANGSYENAETTLSAEVDGKTYTLRLEKITADLQANNSVLMSAVFNGEDLVNMATALRGHNITLTLGNCIDYVGPKCGMDSNQIATAKRFFTDMCALVSEYTGKPFNVTLSTTVTDFYSQYWDNIRDYALQFGGEKHWGAAYPFGFYKADDGFTFNIPTPNKVWFDDFEESTSGSIEDFVAYWSAKDGYHNFPFKKLAEKFAEKVDDETFQAIKKLNFSTLGNTYQRWVNRFNDSLEEVYLYRMVE